MKLSANIYIYNLHILKKLLYHTIYCGKRLNVQGTNWTEEDEITALAKVKGALFALDERRVGLQLILDKTQCTIAYMNSTGKSLGPIQELFKKASFVL